MRIITIFYSACLVFGMARQLSAQPNPKPVKSTTNQTDMERIKEPLVKAALTAMQNENRTAWLNLFAADAKFTDDGQIHDLKKWSDTELFSGAKTYFISLDKVENNGLTIYGKLHTGRWGEFRVFMKFKVSNGKITSLDTGQAH